MDVVDLRNSKQLKEEKPFCQELCLVYFPHSAGSSMLPNLSQSIFTRGYTPVTVSSTGEALIQSRQAKFAVVILPESEVELLKKVRDPDGENCNTPVIVISSTDVLTESTLHLLESHVIQEVVVMAADMEKFEKDLLSALHRIVQKSHQSSEGPFSYFMPLQPQMAQEALLAVTPQGPSAYCALNKEPKVEGTDTCSKMKGFTQAPFNNTASLGFLGPPGVGPALVNPTVAMLPFGPPSEVAKWGLLETLTKTERKISKKGKKETIFKRATPVQSAPLLHTSNHTPAGEKMNFSAAVRSVQGDSLDGLPGIQTLLDGVRARETQNSVQNTSDAEHGPACSSDADSVRKMYNIKNLPKKATTFYKYSVSSGANGEPGDEKSPLSVTVQRPYFLTLGQTREALEDDPSVRPADRHNAKERHRRIRISKASEFFKAALPCMTSSMDKASTFYMTTCYVSFLRNALHQRDPSILENLKKTFKEDWSGVFDMAD